MDLRRVQQSECSRSLTKMCVAGIGNFLICQINIFILKKYITSGLCGKFMYYWHKLRLITYAITYGNNSKEFKTITWMNDVCCQNTIMNKSMIFSGTTGEYFWCISRKRLSKVRPYSMVDLFLKVKKKMKSVFQINLTTVTHS